MKLQISSTVSPTNAAINEELQKIEAVLEGRIGSENVAGNESRVAEVPSSLVSDFVEYNRPIGGVKFFGHKNGEQNFEDSTLLPVLALLKNNIHPQTLTARTAFILNPDNTEYSSQYSDDTGTLVSKQNLIRQEQQLVWKLSKNQRVVTGRRIKELNDSGAISFSSEQYVDPTIVGETMGLMGAAYYGPAISETSKPRQLPGLEYSIDNPIVTWKVYRETDLEATTGRVTCAVSRDDYEEFSISVSLCLLTGLPKDHFYTLIIEADILVEEVL